VKICAWVLIVSGLLVPGPAIYCVQSAERLPEVDPGRAWIARGRFIGLGGGYAAIAGVIVLYIVGLFAARGRK
jgi:hypothetical protein